MVDWWSWLVTYYYGKPLLQDILALSMLSVVNHQSEPNQPAQDRMEIHGLQVGDLGTIHPLPYNGHIATKFH